MSVYLPQLTKIGKVKLTKHVHIIATEFPNLLKILSQKFLKEKTKVITVSALQKALLNPWHPR